MYLQASFSDLILADHYDSDETDVLQNFYKPVVSRAVRYDRAVGYFSVKALISIAKELSTFVKNDGKIRLVVGCFIDPSELDGLTSEQIEFTERKRVRELLISTLDQLEQESTNASSLLSKLVVADVLEIKLALRKAGIYHEKFGIFCDAEGRKVAFHGSVNETNAAFDSNINHESFNVFISPDLDIYKRFGSPLEQKFEQYWLGKANHTKIYSLDEVVIRKIRQMASSDQFSEPESNFVPKTINLRDYQEAALKAWAQNGNCGILAMATGSGKTKTALAALKKFKEKVPAGIVCITVPYQNLALQWNREIRDLGLSTILVYQDSNKWKDRVERLFQARESLANEPEGLPVLVCVNDSYKSQNFQSLLRIYVGDTPKPNLLIVDECHHFNADRQLPKLCQGFGCRLGLSATPYDQFDDEESRFLDKYFKGVVFEFTLADAIQSKFLTPYDYHIFPVYLNPSETEGYEEITKKIVRKLGGEEGLSRASYSEVLPDLLARARIVGAAESKLEALRQHLQRIPAKGRTLFYCGDGQVGEDDFKIRQVEAISQLLARIGWNTSRVTSEESLATRESLIESFTEGYLDGLVSIRVLDEGIDIPSCETAFLLASQSSDRQGIQRRGRLLRLFAGKTHAVLYDFIVMGGASDKPSMMNLKRKELDRARKFAMDARNSLEILEQIEMMEK
jgi:superfamily II DNA or RNA helicase